MKATIEKYRRDRSEDNINYLREAAKKQNRQGGCQSVPYFSPDLGKKECGVSIFEDYPYLKMFTKLNDTRKEFQKKTEKYLLDRYGQETMKKHPRKQYYYPDSPYIDLGKDKAREFLDGAPEAILKYLGKSAYTGDGVLKEPRMPPKL